MPVSARDGVIHYHDNVLVTFNGFPGFVRNLCQCIQYINNGPNGVQDYFAFDFRHRRLTLRMNSSTAQVPVD